MSPHSPVALGQSGGVIPGGQQEGRFSTGDGVVVVSKPSLKGRIQGSILVPMTAATRNKVLSLYSRLFRIARNWQAQSGVKQDTEAERNYIVLEARSLFRQNQKLTDQESVKRCIDECEARIEMGLHYRNPFPRASYLPPMGLATQKGRRLLGQQRLRRQAKPVYLQSQDDT
ncbi:unnamed protein product [Gadus morhua 'NCC']